MNDIQIGLPKKVLRPSKRDVWAAIVLPIVITVIPYAIIWMIYPPQGVREIFFDIRLWALLGVFAVGLLARIKIFAVESGFLKNKKTEKYIDIVLTLLIWPAFCVLLVFSIPVLVFLVVLVFFAKNSKTAHVIIDGTIYLLSVASLFVFGVIVDIRGTFPEGGFLVVLNHESTIDYFLWPVILGWKISKIVAGENLVDFPIVGLFFAIKCIIVDRTNTESKIKILRKIQLYLQEGMRIALAPGDGRQRRSEGSGLRKFKRSSFGIVDDTIPVVPVLVLDSGLYKPPVKKEPLARPLWKFQWYNSPRRLPVIILEPLRRGKSEPAEDFSQRVYQNMLACKQVYLTKKV